MFIGCVGFGSEIARELLGNCSGTARELLENCLLRNCSESALDSAPDLIWNCSGIALKLLWNCSGIALELLWICSGFVPDWLKMI